MKLVCLMCDDCGMEITDPDVGELAWAKKDKAKTRVLVAHAPFACPRWRHLRHNLPEPVQERASVSLDYFLGDSGLLELLSRIETGDIPVKMGLELIRRLHVPGYEQYRMDRKEQCRSGSQSKFPAKPSRQAFCEYLDWKEEEATLDSQE